MDETVTYTIRLPKTTRQYLEAKAAATGVTVADIIKTHLRIGSENTKEVEETLKRKRDYAIQALRFEEADAELKIELKKAFLIENFRKLHTKIRNASMEPKRRQAVTDAMIRRMEIVLGKDSEEFKEATHYATTDKESHPTRKK